LDLPVRPLRRRKLGALHHGFLLHSYYLSYRWLWRYQSIQPGRESLVHLLDAAGCDFVLILDWESRFDDQQLRLERGNLQGEDIDAK